MASTTNLPNLSAMTATERLAWCKSLSPHFARRHCPNYFSIAERAHPNWTKIQFLLIPKVTDIKGRRRSRYVSDGNDEGRVYDRAERKEISRFVPAWDGLVLDLLEGEVRKKKCIDNARKCRRLQVTREERGKKYKLCWELKIMEDKLDELGQL